MHRSDPERLAATVAGLLRASGVGEETALTVARSLVEAECSGHASHGLIRVAEYVRHVREGSVVPDSEAAIVRDGGNTLLVDGGWGFGQVIARRATDWLIERAREHGTAAVAVRRCSHLGRLGAYPELAADAGLIAFAFANGGGKEPRLAPHQGARPVFGTNPFAAAVPLPDAPPVVIDFSTAAVASGKIRVRRDQGQSLPEGWITDRDGRPSTAPEDYYDGGMLLPAAGHKGYGLALLVEFLAGSLTGAGSVAVPNSGYELGNGLFLMAVDPGRFGADGEFATAAGALAGVVRATPPAPGSDEVLLPGDPERRSAARAGDGICVAGSTWRTIEQLGDELGVETA